MKQSYNIILYSLIGLVLVGGLLLFLFRNLLLGYFGGNLDLNSPAAAITLSARDTLDPTILKAKQFTTLTNYVVNFNFDSICWRPDITANQPAVTSPTDIATGTGTATGTEQTVTPRNCRQGNDLPFLVKTKSL